MVNRNNYREDDDNKYGVSTGHQEYAPKTDPSENPWDNGFDQADQGNITKTPKLPSENRETNLKVQKSKDMTVLILMIIIDVFLAACGALSGVAIALNPWWKHSREVPTNHEWIRIGLWEGCIKENEGDDWLCHSYGNSDQTNSPNSDIEILQYLSIAGAGVSGLALILTIITMFLKKSKIFRFMLYVVTGLCLASAALFGVVIGLVTDTTKAKEIVPSDIQLKTQVTGEDKLEFGLMFFLLCAGGGCVFMALIFTAVVLFVHDDLNLEDLRYDDEEDENLDEEGFPLQEDRPKKKKKKEKQYIDYIDGDFGPNLSQMDNGVYPNYPESRRHNEPQRYRRGRDHYQQDSHYLNPAFNHEHHSSFSRHHMPYEDDVSRGRSHHASPRYLRPPNHLRPSSSGRISGQSRPSKPPRALHERHQQANYRGEIRRSNYEDYDMYFNAPY